jgi:hypothetical protein
MTVLIVVVPKFDPQDEVVVASGEWRVASGEWRVVGEF